MLNFSKLKILYVLGVVALSIIFFLPNVLPESVLKVAPSWWRPIQLGLDLQGGSYLLLEVDTEAVARQQRVDLEETVRGALREEQIRYRNLRGTEQGVFVTILDEEDRTRARDAIVVAARGMDIEAVGGDRFKVSVPPRLQAATERSTVMQSLEIVRRRIDEFGTSEPSIQRQGSDRIIVELPGVGNPERIKSLIGQTAQLNFHLVESGASSSDTKNLPPGTVLLPHAQDESHTYVVRRRVEVSGERLVDAQATIQDGRPIVSFRFDTPGGRRFGALTSRHVGDYLAIVLDNKVISAPVIRSAITGGSGMIEGGFATMEGANDLALLLRAGALPAPLLIIEERTVGPGLGHDSIEAGTKAVLLGAVFVFIFMIIAYHTFGMFAVVGQFIHIIGLFAVMSVLGGTLTLPGLAGVVLSVGMAVDANVLIYERMREELASGRSLLNAITSGFSRAYATIIDSNLTNLIGALLLFFLGAGPVRGFAVTLSIGIITSVFSAVMVTRLSGLDVVSQRQA